MNSIKIIFITIIIIFIYFLILFFIKFYTSPESTTVSEQCSVEFYKKLPIEHKKYSIAQYEVACVEELFASITYVYYLFDKDFQNQEKMSMRERLINEKKILIKWEIPDSKSVNFEWLDENKLKVIHHQSKNLYLRNEKINDAEVVYQHLNDDNQPN